MKMDRVILGENAVYSTDCRETGINNNILVVGSSGCGKTMSISEPLFLECENSSLIATVTKRRIVKKYKSLFWMRGYEVLDLDLTDPGGSDAAFDPMAYVHTSADMTLLAESIVMANPKKHKTTADPFWDDSSISLLSAEIAYVKELDPRGTFAEVLMVHDALEFTEKEGSLYTTLDNCFKDLKDKNPHSFAAKCWDSFHRLPLKTAQCVYGTLNSVLDTIFTPEIRRMVSRRRSVDFHRLASKKTVLFVTTSPVNHAQKYFANLFYSQMFKSLFEFGESRPDGRLPVPVRVLCDDFATGSKIPEFAELISIFREKQISVTLLLQSESQLEQMYGSDEATTIINNCDTIVYMGGMDLMTARSMSQRLNVPLDEVLYMPLGRIHILRRGARPLTTARYDISRDKRYQKITRQYEENLRKQAA